MVTRNFERLMAFILGANTTGHHSFELPLISTSGAPFYISDYTFAGSNTTLGRIVGSTSATGNGVDVGSDGTPTTGLEWNLNNRLTGVTIAIAAAVSETNKYGDMIQKINVSVTNNNNFDVTVREICYKQWIYGCEFYGVWTSSWGVLFSAMLDRTVLDEPITIPPGETGIIIYRLASSLYGPRTIQGVPIVTFRDGTDEEIGAMIDAARQDKFDLQKDCGWSVGDIRTIHIDAFTGGGNTSHAAQDLDIVITSFDDYNNCGCLFQFDSRECLATKQRMNPTNTVNYGATEMVSTTLPALEAALPSWLKSRLIPFDVLYHASYHPSENSVLTNQKLAIRSSVESRNDGNAIPPDGEYMEYYSSSGYRNVYFKNGSSAGFTPSRTPYNGNGFAGFGSNSYGQAVTAMPVMFFGCV